jgi:hypothetical protein
MQNHKLARWHSDACIGATVFVAKLDFKDLASEVFNDCAYLSTPELPFRQVDG